MFPEKPNPRNQTVQNQNNIKPKAKSNRHLRTIIYSSLVLSENSNTLDTIQSYCWFESIMPYHFSSAYWYLWWSHFMLLLLAVLERLCVIIVWIEQLWTTTLPLHILVDDHIFYCYYWLFVRGSVSFISELDNYSLLIPKFLWLQKYIFDHKLSLGFRYKKVAYLDTDVGQTEFTPPGLLSLTTIDKITSGTSIIPQLLHVCVWAFQMTLLFTFLSFLLFLHQICQFRA